MTIESEGDREIAIESEIARHIAIKSEVQSAKQRGSEMQGTSEIENENDPPLYLQLAKQQRAKTLKAAAIYVHTLKMYI